jgi:hypothetical protein
MILKTVAIFLALETVFLGVWTGMPISKAEWIIGSGETLGFSVQQCSQETGFGAFMGVQLAFIACIVLAAALIAFKTRK